jgi:hypothetical protein
MENKRINTKIFSDTNSDEVKRLNAQSGLSYNEVFTLLAKKGNSENNLK